MTDFRGRNRRNSCALNQKAEKGAMPPFPKNVKRLVFQGFSCFSGHLQGGAQHATNYSGLLRCVARIPRPEKVLSGRNCCATVAHSCKELRLEKPSATHGYRSGPESVSGFQKSLPLQAEGRRRGRPRRFAACPECGEPSIFVQHTERRGHCENVYCVCRACGMKLRYVSAGAGGHWFKVRAAASKGAA